MKIIIAGGTGFLGKVLSNYFAETNEVIILTRGNSCLKDGLRFESWDAKTQDHWSKVLDHADVLINLVGKSVDCRYNEKNKREILESRIQSTTALGDAVMKCKYPPKIWLNSASATIYRHSLDKQMEEEDGEIGEGFSVEVCKAWEKAFFNFKLTQTRQVALRTAIVLGKTGGAIQPLINLARFGLGGKQGSGDQFFSWIHEEDFARAVEFIIQHEALSGPVNIVSPKPIRNKDVMQKVRKIVRMPFGLPMPKFLLDFGAKIIRTETELILKSRYVIPVKLALSGFTFTYANLDEALTEIRS